MDKGFLDFSVATPLEGNVAYLLGKVSRKLGEPEEEILYRLTSFEGRDGHKVEGKRSIYEVSDGQLEVVLRKLKGMLRQEENRLQEHREGEAECSVS